MLTVAYDDPDLNYDPNDNYDFSVIAGQSFSARRSVLDNDLGFGLTASYLPNAGPEYGTLDAFYPALHVRSCSFRWGADRGHIRKRRETTARRFSILDRL